MNHWQGVDKRQRDFDGWGIGVSRRAVTEKLGREDLGVVEAP